METIEIGLIKGRHEMPVGDYIINFEIDDPYEEINEIKDWIHYFLLEKIGITTKTGCGINQASYEDVICYEGNKKLIVYVTGLTIVTAELIRQCMCCGVNLTLMHYNVKTKEYVSQVIC